VEQQSSENSAHKYDSVGTRCIITLHYRCLYYTHWTGAGLETTIDYDTAYTYYFFHFSANCQVLMYIAGHLEVDINIKSFLYFLLMLLRLPCRWRQHGVL